MQKDFTTRITTKNKEAGIYEAMISTEEVDREGDIILASGAVTDNYMRNPVVLFAHDYHTPPVAKALKIEKIPGQGLKAVFQFPTRGINKLADSIRGLWEEGFLNATSIGFRSLKSEPRGSVPGYIISQFELLEFSIVPVPANQGALALRSLRKGYSKDLPDDLLYKLIDVHLEYCRIMLLPQPKRKRQPPR